MFKDHLKVGNLILEFCASEMGLKSVGVVKRTGPIASSQITEKFKRELTDYLAGKIKTFKTPLDIEGTEFQKTVWSKLTEIPYGETNSYKDVAIKVGGGNFSRAVGMANNKNPLPIIIPCHRVVGSNGDLVGYALGLELKKMLLELENKTKVGQ